jgi:hypothetical protein
MMTCERLLQEGCHEPSEPVAGPRYPVRDRLAAFPRDPSAHGPRAGCTRRHGGPPRIRVIVNESAIDRIRHEDFLAEQLSLLDEIAALPGVEIHFLPTEVGLHASSSNSYMIMTFDDQVDPDLVYTETPGGAKYESDRAIVARYRRVFRATVDDAVPYEIWRQRSTR